MFFFFSDTIQTDCFSNQKDNELDRTFLITLIINNVNNVEKNSTFDIKYLYQWSNFLLIKYTIE